MSKYFTGNFVHGSEAFWSEKWPISGLGEALPDEKSGRKRRRIAHRPHFCARFLLKFCYFSRFCKHAKFSKVNAKFSKGIDFWKPRNAFFSLKLNQFTDNQLFSKISKNGLFFVQMFFRGEFLKYGGQKWPFCQYLSKKITLLFRQISMLLYCLRRNI